MDGFLAALLRDSISGISLDQENRQISITVNSGIKYITRWKKHSVLISNLFLVTLFTCKAQNIEQTLDFGSRQFNMGNTQETIGLYRRGGFFFFFLIPLFFVFTNPSP